MNVANSTMLAMALAGALAGLAGVVIVLGGATSYQVTQGISSNIGFDALTVALLGRLSPWGTVYAGLLFGILKQGGTEMQATVAIPVDIVTVIQALIVIFIAAPQLTRSIFHLPSHGMTAFNTATTNLAVAVTTETVPRIPRHLLVGGTQIVAGLFGSGATRSAIGLHRHVPTLPAGRRDQPRRRGDTDAPGQHRAVSAGGCCRRPPHHGQVGAEVVRDDRRRRTSVRHDHLVGGRLTERSQRGVVAAGLALPVGHPADSRRHRGHHR
jgi:hypothetical protein